MSNRQNGSQRVGLTKREERAQRILNVAAELIQRWGYNKTTIDDIARQAGVAKGTIYLHWKTREDLFRALMAREKIALVEDLQRRIADDPEGMTLHGMCKQGMLAVMKNPLMKAVLLSDTDVLGELTRVEHGTAAYAEQITKFNAYFEVLRRQGMVRDDLGLREAMYMLSAICVGFMLVEPFLPDQFKLSDEASAEMMAETIRRTFEPSTPVTPEALRIISSAFNDYIDQYIDYKLERMETPS